MLHLEELMYGCFSVIYPYVCLFIKFFKWYATGLVHGHIWMKLPLKLVIGRCALQKFDYVGHFSIEVKLNISYKIWLCLIVLCIEIRSLEIKVKTGSPSKWIVFNFSTFYKLYLSTDFCETFVWCFFFNWTEIGSKIDHRYYLTLFSVSYFSFDLKLFGPSVGVVYCLSIYLSVCLTVPGHLVRENLAF